MSTSKLTGLLCVTLCIIFSKAAVSQNNSGAFTFKLSNSARTSAGVYKKDSTLVRTLWADKTYSPGTYTEYWDGKDDCGNTITSPDATYDIKVLSNNVKYQWDGIIGNTSTAQTGSTIHKNVYTSMTGMAITGTTAYFCQGYSEGFPGEAYFDINNPQARQNIYVVGTSNIDCDFVTTDGINVYWAGYDIYYPSNTMVHAIKVSDRSAFTFSSSSGSYSSNHVSLINSTVGKLNQSNSIITGLAASGSYLFIARGGLNQVGVYNKTTGALVQTLTYSNPRYISIDGSSFWMCTGSTATGNVIAKYPINSNGSLGTSTLTLSGITIPGATQSNGNGTVAVIDSVNQVVRFFNTSTGVEGTQLGTNGGYSTNPMVTNTRFMFNDYRSHTYSFITFAPDGSFWVGDPGNYRELHYNSSKAWIETIMSMGATYSTCVDPNNITRVFGNYLEFAIDYSKPLSGSTGWKLAKNWAYPSLINITAVINTTKLLNIVTLSNGRTYGYNYLPPSGLVELTSTGLRNTGVSIGNGVMNTDGSLTKWIGTDDFGKALSLVKYPLTGFDGSGNPIWSSTGTILSTTPVQDAGLSHPIERPGLVSPTSYNFVTASGKVIWYAPQTLWQNGGVTPISRNGYHLGAIKLGQSSFSWETQKSDHINYTGKFPEADYFEIGNIVNNYAGSNINVVDNNIITGYHGEHWKNSQTNYFNHYYEDGLAIGQFGTDGSISLPTDIGAAGNALSPIVVKDAAGDLYLYHGDESAHAGIHRWKISNLSSITEQYINIAYPSNYYRIAYGYLDLHSGLPFISSLPNSAGWSQSGTVTSNTGLKKYIDDGSPDVYSVFSQSTGTASINRDLGSNNVNNSWKISGELTFEGSDYVVGTYVHQYLDVLDGAGKILARFNYLGNSTTKVVTIYANNSIVASTTGLQATLDQMQSFEVKIINGAVTFTYAGFPPITTALFDPTANWRQPRTLRQYWTSGGTPARSMYIGFVDMKFYKDYSQAINIPPVANAGSDQTITLPINNVTLTGTGTDSDGTVTNYAWIKISGSTSGTITNSTNSTTTVTGLIQGIYKFQLKVTDNVGATNLDTVQVIVNAAANIPPVAGAGVDQAITLPSNSIMLNGSGTDADGSITKYSWTKLSGPSSGTITNSNNANTNVTSLVQGIYNFELKVTDNLGATGLDTVQVTVNAAANIPPVANAGVDQAIMLPVNSVTLNGSGTDADGRITKYSWAKISGPSSGTITNSNNTSTTVTGLMQGSYSFELKVTDNSGATGVDTMQVNVNAAANIPPIANAGADQSITLPINSVILNGTGIDADGSITKYSWTKILGPSSGAITNSNNATTTVTGLVKGTYNFELKVTDNSGASAVDTVQILVNPPANIPPVANAGMDQVITLPNNLVSLAGSGGDADGSIVAYAWTKISGPSSYSIVNSSSPVTDIFGLISGVYTFELKVTDNSGAIARDTMQVTVNLPANIPPVVDAGTAQMLILPKNRALLDGTANDPDGTVVSYSWKEIAGLTSAIIANANAANTVVGNLAQGNYLFELSVTDDLGGVGKDTVQIRVVASSLPLKLLSFTGKIQTDFINLFWETTNERNVLGFEIERMNGATWNKIGFVQANNSGLISNQYTFIDSLPSIGSNYYRLKVIDADGKFVYSDIISFEVNPRKNLIYQNFPNPFSNFTTIKFEIAQKNSVKVMVYNSIGMQVAVLLNEIKLPGVYQILWNASNVAQGDYFYKVIVGETIVTNKMLKLY